MKDVTDDPLAELKTVLASLPGGLTQLKAAAALGMWTPDAHSAANKARPFPQELSALLPGQVVDLHARLAARADVVYELLGLLNALEVQQEMKVKQAISAARNRARAAVPADQKPLTKTELDDLAEDDVAVMEARSHMAVIRGWIGVVAAQEKKLLVQEKAISRSITLLTSQMSNGLSYGG